MSRPVNDTRSLTPALMLMAFAAFVSTPAVLPRALMWIDFVIVTAPNPPGSSTLISPFAAVFEIAPAKVLHGAVRLHGLASSPTPETQVRVAWACAGAPMIGTARPQIKVAKTRRSIINLLFL